MRWRGFSLSRRTRTRRRSRTLSRRCRRCRSCHIAVARFPARVAVASRRIASHRIASHSPQVRTPVCARCAAFALDVAAANAENLARRPAASIFPSRHLARCSALLFTRALSPLRSSPLVHSPPLPSTSLLFSVRSPLLSLSCALPRSPRLAPYRIRAPHVRSTLEYSYSRAEQSSVH